MNKYAQHYFNTYISKRAAERGAMDNADWTRVVDEQKEIIRQLQAKPAVPAAPAPGKLVVPNPPGGINDTKKKWNEGKSTVQGGMQLAPGPVKQGALNYISYFTKMAARGSDELNDIANGNTSKQLGYASPMTAKDREDYDRQGEKIKKENIRLNGAPKSPVAIKIPKPPKPSVAPKLPKPKTNSPSGASSYDDKDSDFMRTLSSGQLFENKDNDKAPAPVPAPARTPLPALPTNLPGASAGAAAGFNKKSALNSIAQFNKLALDPASSAKPKDDPTFNPYAKMKGPTEGFGKDFKMGDLKTNMPDPSKGKKHTGIEMPDPRPGKINTGV